MPVFVTRGLFLRRHGGHARGQGLFGGGQIARQTLRHARVEALQIVQVPERECAGIVSLWTHGQIGQHLIAVAFVGLVGIFGIEYRAAHGAVVAVARHFAESALCDKTRFASRSACP